MCTARRLAPGSGIEDRQGGREKGPHRTRGEALTHGSLKAEGDQRGPVRRRIFETYPEVGEHLIRNANEGRARKHAEVNSRVPDPKTAEAWAEKEKRLLGRSQ